MMKALKLFAKNHHELEKVSDPEKGHNRRVLSYDNRTAAASSSIKNVPASTFEKCGGTIPSGPKFVNELVEKELANYKAEVEIKHKASVMNSEYVFERTKSIHNKEVVKQGGVTAVSPEFYIPNFVQAKLIGDDADMHREGSASPVSRTVDKMK